ncbi:hypothetical protein TNCV_2798451 [Trichonephila clavipes]|nr:hypothetical protein TNCV_2798451 [Trichonephila clavipes]
MDGRSPSPEILSWTCRHFRQTGHDQEKSGDDSLFTKIIRQIIRHRDILTQQHVSSSVLPMPNVFHHGGQPVPVELSIASIPEDGTEPKVIFYITVDHSTSSTDKDRRLIVTLTNCSA